MDHSWKGCLQFLHSLRGVDEGSSDEHPKVWSRGQTVGCVSWPVAEALKYLWCLSQAMA